MNQLDFVIFSFVSMHNESKFHPNNVHSVGKIQVFPARNNNHFYHVWYTSFAIRSPNKTTKKCTI